MAECYSGLPGCTPSAVAEQMPFMSVVGRRWGGATQLYLLSAAYALVFHLPWTGGVGPVDESGRL